MPKANKPKKPLSRRQKQRNELRAQQEFTLEKLMLVIQVCQHWGIIKIRQDGEIIPVFDHNRNIPCAWLNTEAKCENEECNWCPEQCIFTGMMKDCKFYDPMIDDNEQYHTVKETEETNIPDPSEEPTSKE